MRTNQNRPKWAKALTASEWKHLLDTYSHPTLKHLTADAETCRDCAALLRKVEARAKECR